MSQVMLVTTLQTGPFRPLVAVTTMCYALRYIY